MWLENWRGSIDFKPNQWNLDQVARYDHPAAVKKVLEQSGAKEMKAIIHCQGSTSFMISSILGLIPEVTLIISNAVSLHPIVPAYSRFKLWVFLPFIKLLVKYLNPQWGDRTPNLTAKFFRLFVLLSHYEKDTRVGKFVSFTYGAGFPALWELENLSEETKEWIRGEFAEVPVSFFDQIKQCVKYKQLVSSDAKEHYLATEPKTKARFVFFTGEKNKCFKAISQKKSFEYFDAIRPNFHKLYTIKNYSHLDIFYGKEAHKDVFPLMIKELDAG